MKSYEFNEVLKRQRCLERGHDFRQVGDTSFYRCKCGAAARVGNGRISIDQGAQKTSEEIAAEKERIKQRWLTERQKDKL